MKQSIQSFSLIEVIIFVGILGMFFVTGMIVVVYSLQTMKVNQHKLIATQYGEQLSAWLRAQKEADWNSFVSHASIVGITYCFKDSPISDWPVSQGDCGVADYVNVSPNIFRRWAILTSDSSPPTRVTIEITVEWKEGGNTYSIPLATVVSRFE